MLYCPVEPADWEDDVGSISLVALGLGLLNTVPVKGCEVSTVVAIALVEEVIKAEVSSGFPVIRPVRMAVSGTLVGDCCIVGTIVLPVSVSPSGLTVPLNLATL